MPNGHWHSYPVQYRLVQRWLPGTDILQCLAPYTPVKLIRQTPKALVTSRQLPLFA